LFTPDSQSILGVERSGGVAQWDALTLKETRRLWGDSTNQAGIALSPDASRMVQVDADGPLHVWNVRSGVESTNLVVAPELYGVRFTDNGRFLVTFNYQSAATNYLFELWETDTWQRTGSITIERESLSNWRALTTSLPNSFVIGTDRTLRFFDVTKPDQAPKQIASQGAFSDLAVSPDGRIAAGADADGGKVRLWDMATLQPVDTLKGFLLGAHSVAFSRDGKRLAAGSNGQEAVKLWDAETRQELLTLSGEGSLFRGVKFSPDGRFLLAINLAGLAHLWSAPTWEEIAAAEAKEKTEIKQP
jgi:WD40 repeat protein